MSILLVIPTPTNTSPPSTTTFPPSTGSISSTPSPSSIGAIVGGVVGGVFGVIIFLISFYLFLRRRHKRLIGPNPDPNEYPLPVIPANTEQITPDDSASNSGRAAVMPPAREQLPRSHSPSIPPGAPRSGFGSSVQGRGRSHSNQPNPQSPTSELASAPPWNTPSIL
jgi:hypothetical protein